MAITVLPNQPIDLHLEADECGCTGQNFCQIVNSTDPTQFQLLSSELVLNGSFEDSESWEVSLGIDLVGTISTVSVTGQCDGTALFVASNFTAPIEFSMDGITYFAGTPDDYTFTGLCEGKYFVTAKDSLGHEASAVFRVVNPVVCGDYNNTIDFDLINTLQLSNCYTIDFI